MTGNYSFLADINLIFSNNSDMEFLSLERGGGKHTYVHNNSNNSGHNPDDKAHIMCINL